MTKTSTLLGGILGCFFLSWAGMVAIPYKQIGNLQPQVDQDAGTAYPVIAGGNMERGRDLFVSYGCVYCHTQEVRDLNNGSDVDRGWGDRRTVARDYIYDGPVLGSLRYGPDLANIGTRKPDPTKGDGPDKYSAAWHYKHLYDPRSVTPKSVMPAFRFLFEHRKISGQVSADAISSENGQEIVPSTNAKVLVSYLMSLDRNQPLKEAPALKEAAAQ